MAKKIRDKLPRATQNGIINALMLVFVPLLLIVLTEWAHRGGFSESFLRTTSSRTCRPICLHGCW